MRLAAFRHISVCVPTHEDHPRAETAETIEAVLGFVPGETVRFGRVHERLDALEQLYGERGYINFEPDVVPDLRDDPIDATQGIADIIVRLDAGTSFTVGRIEFKGNTYTRDKVLRREMVLDEGATFNKRYFDLSILRLNQLGYFNHIEETDFDIRSRASEMNSFVISDTALALSSLRRGCERSSLPARRAGSYLCSARPPC